ncbi:hypothetical protein R6242_04360 [Iodobacter sp. CM08]|uniref:hypothetical protein n=1 Tax=Iodobacter sp. CM08 TaxID=3085902 RepID=UPI002980BA6C|nr:hypothetical protein [Iodobacter sp. CM08]MDW5415804.1 hypothetical protein [Iodobacter sp. CM08]
MRKACKQLEDIFLENAVPMECGVVALDVSKIINAKNQVFISKNDSDLRASLSLLMDDFIHKNSRIWNVTFERKNEKLIGIILFFSFMSGSESRSILVHSSEVAISPRHGVSEKDRRLLQYLVAVLKCP